MRNKLYWGIGTLFILLIIGATVIVLFKDRAAMRQLETELEALQKRKDEQNTAEVLKEDQNTPEVSKEEHPEHGHIHEDGTFHVGEHDDPIQPPSRDYTPTQIQIPDGITDPDVKAAWERLDYIANNIWEWGGVPSNRAVELIDILMPLPDGFSGPTGHRDGEEAINMLAELAWIGDPRAAEVIAKYNCEGLIGGLSIERMLIEMGVPAVPYLVSYMLDETHMPALRSNSIAALGPIAEKHRKDLGGIVEHIIIPRLEAILAEEEPDYFEGAEAREALALLK